MYYRRWEEFGFRCSLSLSGVSDKPHRPTPVITRNHLFLPTSPPPAIATYAIRTTPASDIQSTSPQVPILLLCHESPAEKKRLSTRLLAVYQSQDLESHVVS